MKKILFIIFLLIFSIGYSQRSYKIESKDGEVIAENFISYDEGIDSVVVINKKYKLKFSPDNGLFNFDKEKNQYDTDDIPNYFKAYSIRKINNQVYLLIGISENVYKMKQRHLIFIKKDKILKYYVTVSNNKRVIDIEFKYLPKTKEVLIPIRKKRTPQDYIFNINLKENKLDTIRPLDTKTDEHFYKYKLKIIR